MAFLKMNLHELGSYFGLKRHSTKMPALKPDEKLEELMNGGQAKRCKLYNEFASKQLGIDAKKFMEIELKKSEFAPPPLPPLPPSPPEDVAAELEIENLDPEDTRFFNFFKKDNKATLILKMNGNLPRTAKKTIKRKNGTSVTPFLNSNTNTHCNLVFPKVTTVMNCLGCNEVFVKGKELKQHMNSNHLQPRTPKVIKNEQTKIKHEKITREPELREQQVQVPKCLTNSKNIKVEEIPTTSATQSELSVSRYFQCEVCSKRMNTNKVLQTHLSKFHLDEILNFPVRFCCEFCERSYKLKTSMRAHTKKAHPEGYVPERRGGGGRKK